VLSCVVLFRNQAFFLKINTRFQYLSASVLLFFCSFFSVQLAFEQIPSILFFTPSICMACASLAITTTTLINVAFIELNEKI
jgi:hypothetical protein